MNLGGANGMPGHHSNECRRQVGLVEGEDGKATDTKLYEEEEAIDCVYADDPRGVLWCEK